MRDSTWGSLNHEVNARCVPRRSFTGVLSKQVCFRFESTPVPCVVAFRSLEVCLEVTALTQRESLVDNLLVGLHFLIQIFGRTGCAPWKFEFIFPGGLVCPPSRKPSQVTSGQGDLAGVGTRKVDIKLPTT